MLIAKVIDGQVINVVDYRQPYGDVIPTDAQLAQKSYMRVNLFRPHDEATERLVPCAPVVEGDWVYMMEVQKLTDEEIQERLAASATIAE